MQKKIYSVSNKTQILFAIIMLKYKVCFFIAPQWTVLEFFFMLLPNFKYILILLWVQKVCTTSSKKIVTILKKIKHT